MALSLAVNLKHYVNGCFFDKTNLTPLKVHSLPLQSRGVGWKPLVVEAKFRKRANSRTESPKIRNRRFLKKYNGTPAKPRLSVFCSDRQLYAMLVDDMNKKCLFYGSTLQKSVRSDLGMSTVDAAKVVGEELVKAAMNLRIHEISSYDRNGCRVGDRVKAFEIALSQHGFLLSC